MSPTSTLTWGLVNATPDLPLPTQTAELTAAFAAWTNVTAAVTVT